MFSCVDVKIWIFLAVVLQALACILATILVGKELSEKFKRVQQIAAPPQNRAVTGANQLDLETFYEITAHARVIHK